MSNFPKRCHLCFEVIEDVVDQDWHGVGKCVDFCAWCIGDGELDGKTCTHCKGSRYVEVLNT
jgi:DnaJ-class molecular chaperone